MKRRDISQRLRQDRGQALIEFILVLPMIFLLILNLVNFGGFFYAWITIANAARAGANYAILGGASVGGLATPGGSDISAKLTPELSSLPASATVNVCQINDSSGTPQKTSVLGSCASMSSLPTDPEPSNYVVTVVDVTYTYQPFIPAFSFPSLGVYLTLPPTTVFQRAVMRSIQ
ncbi:MAG TPA: TadE family protein [Acidobacteriaceae bacterium]|nr:TadE family protein [Acidobacteriaceae bacterium]